MENKIRTIFIGTPDFAVPCLKKLVSQKDIELVLVITQEDKPVGRKKTITAPPVKKIAQELNLPILQPKKLKDDEVLQKIKETNPELIIVAAYGKIIPKSILDLPKYGTLNIHASLLPKYRGASPIQNVIVNGEKETGITIMLLDKEMDHGDVLTQEKITITDNETAGSLFEKLAPLGAELLTKTLPDWILGKIKLQSQNHDEATFTKILTREDGKIDWNQDAKIIEQKVRGFSPWPGTWTNLNHKNQTLRLSIHEAKVISDNSGKKPGTVFSTPDGFAVVCKKDALEITVLQREGKQKMTAKEFIAGHQDIIDSILF